MRCESGVESCVVLGGMGAKLAGASRREASTLPAGWRNKDSAALFLCRTSHALPLSLSRYGHVGTFSQRRNRNLASLFVGLCRPLCTPKSL